MALFVEGAQFPPPADIKRLAKYKKMRSYFHGTHWEVYDRARALLEGSPQQAQLDHLYVAINLPYILTLKPADLLVGEPPRYESGMEDDSKEQIALKGYVKENDLTSLIHESATANGYRGDSWIKTRFGYRHDYSELEERGLKKPIRAKMEPIIEHVNASTVFPETMEGNIKKFKAINIATVSWVDTVKVEIPFLNIERHIPGYIINEKYKLHERPEVGVDNSHGVPISLYTIGEKIFTDGEKDKTIETGLCHMPVFHIPYSSVDDDWQGQGFIEKIADALNALEDRFRQLDYILLKHADPTIYGPPLEGTGDRVSFGGKYLTVSKEDATPGAITWDGQLDSVFKEMEFLLSHIFQMSETPQWLFGTTMSGGGGSQGGSGTSHTDGAAIKARFMPILSKVNRIKTHYDPALRSALQTCYLYDKIHGDYKGTDVYPVIGWQDGIPNNELEMAQIASLRTGGKETMDVQTAIKYQDDVDDASAREIMSRIDADNEKVEGYVDSDTFNNENNENEV